MENRIGGAARISFAEALLDGWIRPSSLHWHQGQVDWPPRYPHEQKVSSMKSRQQSKPSKWVTW